MFALNRLRVPVRDLAAARGFWTALLGRPPAEEAPDSGSARYHVDGLDLLLIVAAGGRRSPGGPLDFELDHDDLGKLLARLPAGAAAEVRETAGGGRSLEARDPDGNQVTVVWRMPER
jgi:catechol 2,3-dioxygenase-like lactoylglutathione lyase family enzyme